jgi:Arc/MetJ-type ribon-helix-helix transcriptional regulator
MTIHLPKDVESSINAAVRSGHFASLDDAMTEAAHLLLQKLNQGQAMADKPAVSEEAIVPAHKPIWEVFQEISARVPDEVWDALPTDLSEQHDHYIYGTPKRTDA